MRWQALLAVLLAMELTALCGRLRSAAAGTEAVRLDDAVEITRRMKAAMEPPVPSIRTIDIELADAQGRTVKWLARQARKHLDDGNRVVLVMLQPASVRGTALLVREVGDGPDEQWVYLPAVRRVRKLVPVGGQQPFLGTDLTYADLGFVSLEDRSFELLGTELYEPRIKGHSDPVLAYKIKEVPATQWYYERIVSWIAVDSLLPLQKDYYATSGTLWKSLTFDTLTTVQGIPTPLRIRMVDRTDGASTTLRIRGVRYEADLPDEIFDPPSLPSLADHPIWAVDSEAGARRVNRWTGQKSGAL